MPPVSIPGGGVPLGATAQVAVTDIQIWEPVSLQFRPGGLHNPNAPMRAEVVNVPKGLVVMFPIALGYAEQLHKQLGELIEQAKRAAGGN